MKSLRQGLGRQSQRSPSRKAVRKRSDPSRGMIAIPFDSVPCGAKQNPPPAAAGDGIRACKQTPAGAGHAQSFRFPCSTNSARRASPAQRRGLCTQKRNHLRMVKASPRLSIWDMVAHCLNAVKHIVRFYARTVRIFGLFELDSGVYVPYNFSQC